MHNPLMKDFVCVSDHQRILVSIFLDNVPLATLIGESFNHCLDSNSQIVLDNLMSQKNSSNSVLFDEANIFIDHNYYPCRLSGYIDEMNIYIFCVFDTKTDQDVLIKMMQLNSEQVNQLRYLSKNLQSIDSKIFQEMTKLNSELLNSRRIIEKQNIELQRFNQLLKKWSIEDGLTGCYNRRYFNEYIKDKFLLSQEDIVNSLVLVDFNHFKQVNDEFGHDAGDRLLIAFVETVKDKVKDIGHIFRIGGDEFIILFLHMNEAQSISKMKEIELLFKEKSHVVTLAYGVVKFTAYELNHEHDLTSLLKKADTLMYKEKRLIKAR